MDNREELDAELVEHLRKADLLIKDGPDVADVIAAIDAHGWVANVVAGDAGIAVGHVSEGGGFGAPGDEANYLFATSPGVSGAQAVARAYLRLYAHVCERDGSATNAAPLKRLGRT